MRPTTLRLPVRHAAARALVPGKLPRRGRDFVDHPMHPGRLRRGRIRRIGIVDDEHEALRAFRRAGCCGALSVASARHLCRLLESI